MILLAVYAVVVWYLAMRWRRRWYGFALVILAALAFYQLAPLLRTISPEWQGMNILITGETILILVAGLFICLLPRPPSSQAHCRYCWYDLGGLEPSGPEGIICPECGAASVRPNLLPRVSLQTSPPQPLENTAEHQGDSGQAADQKPTQR